MDFESLGAALTKRVHIVHPEQGALFRGKGKGRKPIEIEIYGSHTRQYKSARSKVLRDHIKNSGADDDLDMDSEMAGCEILACATKAVHNFEDYLYKGEPITVENIRDVYLDDQFFWLREQLAEAAGEKKGFFSKG